MVLVRAAGSGSALALTRTIPALDVRRKTGGRVRNSPVPIVMDLTIPLVLSHPRRAGLW